jgi:acetyl esterase/lipase
MAMWTVLSGLTVSSARVVPRRLRRGPLHPGWTLGYEIFADALKRSAVRINKLPPSEQGREWERVSLPHPILKRARFEEVSAGGVPAEWILPREGADGAPVVFHLHGGWYSSASPRNFHEWLARLVVAVGSVRLLSLDYRLAPEHPFPAALDDALAAWRWLLASGVQPSRTVIVGESAGGGLAAALMLRLRDAKEPLPAGAALLSPWVDLSARGGSLETNAPFDWCELEDVPNRVRFYVGDRDPRTPLASPALADLRGLPPLLVQAGGAEMLLDQGVRFAEKAKEAGVPVTLDVVPGMIHVGHLFAAVSPDARAAIDRTAAFIRSSVGASR